MHTGNFNYCGHFHLDFLGADFGSLFLPFWVNFDSDISNSSNFMDTCFKNVFNYFTSTFWEGLNYFHCVNNGSKYLCCLLAIDIRFYILTDMASMTRFMTNVPNPRNAIAVSVRSYKSVAVSPRLAASESFESSESSSESSPSLVVVSEPKPE